MADSFELWKCIYMPSAGWSLNVDLGPYIAKVQVLCTTSIYQATTVHLTP